MNTIRKLKEELKKTSAGRQFLEEAEPEKQTDNLIEFAKEQCEIFPEDSYMGKYLRETIKILQAEPCEDVPDTNVGNKMQAESCGDAVSRKDLERLKRWRFSYYTNTTIPKSDLFVRLTDIRALPSVKSAQVWIPVSERSPENETCVLTTIKIPNRIARVRSGWYDSGFIQNDNGDVWKTTDMEVLAWMPLPKPYKGE